MDISLPCSTTQARAHHLAIHTEVPSILSKLIFQKFHEVLSFGFGIVELVLVHLLAVLLVDGLSLIHTVIYDAYKQTNNQQKRNKSFIVELESETIKIWR